MGAKAREVDESTIMHKTKTAKIVGLVGTLLIGLVGCNAVLAQKPLTPESVTLAFYRWYIPIVDRGGDPFIKGKVTLRKYVTARLIKEIKQAKAQGFDDDKFIPSRQFDGEWVEHMTISGLEIEPPAATLILIFPGARSVVTLLKERGVWKIDGVKDADGPIRQ